MELSTETNIETSDYEVRFIRKNERLNMVSSRHLQPIELMEVLANIFNLIPNELRSSILSVVEESIKHKSN